MCSDSSEPQRLLMSHISQYTSYMSTVNIHHMSHRKNGVFYAPLRISRCTGVPSGSTILCRTRSLKTGSGIHRVVAVRNVFKDGVAVDSRHGNMYFDIRKFIKFLKGQNIVLFVSTKS